MRPLSARSAAAARAAGTKGVAAGEVGEAHRHLEVESSIFIDIHWLSFLAKIF
jgi:hypothetical protein